MLYDICQEEEGHEEDDGKVIGLNLISVDKDVPWRHMTQGDTSRYLRVTRRRLCHSSDLLKSLNPLSSLYFVLWQRPALLK